jgi:hypothetical protein
MFDPNEKPVTPAKPRQAKRPKATALSLQASKVKTTMARIYTALKDGYGEIQTAIWDGTINELGEPEYTGEELIGELAKAGVITPEELQWLASTVKAMLNHLVKDSIIDPVTEAKITI